MHKGIPYLIASALDDVHRRSAQDVVNTIMVACICNTNYRMANSVLARPLPRGTVPFGASNVPFGSAPESLMLSPLVFRDHLNYFNYLNRLGVNWLKTAVRSNSLHCRITQGTTEESTMA